MEVIFIANNYDNIVQLYYFNSSQTGINTFSRIVIDGIEASISEIDQNKGKYTFTTTGIHTVKYKLLSEYETAILDNLFESCDFYSIKLPASIESIEYSAFKNCSKLISVNILSNIIETIEQGAFEGCTNLISINIPDSVNYISNSVFKNCSKLMSVNIPDDVSNIYADTFYNCTSLTSITIPSNVTTISMLALYGCSSLETITCLAATAPTISNNTFLNIKTGGTLYVPQGSIGYDTWMQNANFYLGKYGWAKVEQ